MPVFPVYPEPHWYMGWEGSPETNAVHVCEASSLEADDSDNTPVGGVQIGVRGLGM